MNSAAEASRIRLPFHQAMLGGSNSVVTVLYFVLRITNVIPASFTELPEQS